MILFVGEWMYIFCYNKELLYNKLSTYTVCKS
jgi:hypothetical protein